MKIISSAFLLEFLTLHTTPLYRIPLIDLAWVFHWFCAWVFVLCLTVKGESSLIFQNIPTRYFGGYMLQFREKEFHKNLSKIIMQNGSVLILVILELWMEDLLHLPRWKKTLFTLKWMWEKIQKSMKKIFLKFAKISKSQIAKTYLTKITSALWDFNNPYLENDLENFHLEEGCP